MSTPFIFVIFGATGDLAHHKLIPALFRLFKSWQMPEDFYIIGFARRSFTDEAFAKEFDEYLDDPAWEVFTKHLSYQSGTFEEEKGYNELIEKLQAIDTKHGACITRIFYLATPPGNYETILDNLKKSKLSEGCGQGSEKWTRVAIEKPFGKDIKTAKMLDQKLAGLFKEEQIFRVDHYLAKDTVQNMLIFRFANSIFEPVLTHEYIDHVQITFAEKKGIGKRGMFFDGVGILRDVAQNHLMQLLAGVVMEMPRSFLREDVRDARVKAIQAIECIDPKDVASRTVRGQYEGYLLEASVSNDSKTESFVAMKFFVNTKRFEGVPFYVRAGKMMKKDQVTISIVFKQTCHVLFKEIGCPEEGNVLTISIAPDEGITFKLIAKQPGTKLALRTVDMHFTYKEQFGRRGTDAYEKLLVDILSGDQMLFNRSDELESSWQFITNILSGWQAYNQPVHIHPLGSMGPREADELIEKDGRKWL